MRVSVLKANKFQGIQFRRGKEIIMHFNELGSLMPVLFRNYATVFIPQPVHKNKSPNWISMIYYRCCHLQTEMKSTLFYSILALCVHLVS